MGVGLEGPSILGHKDALSAGMEQRGQRRYRQRAPYDTHSQNAVSTHGVNAVPLGSAGRGVFASLPS